jgi:hypothetical protein
MASLPSTNVIRLGGNNPIGVNAHRRHVCIEARITARAELRAVASIHATRRRIAKAHPEEFPVDPGAYQRYLADCHRQGMAPDAPLPLEGLAIAADVLARVDRRERERAKG